MEKKIQFVLNGKNVEATYEDNDTLLWALRTQFDLTGTKYGCGEGYCGSCTVLMDNMAVRSCNIYLQDVADSEIITIEGLQQNGKLHPVQQAFADNDALQCGFCTPGMIMNAVSFLRDNPEPSREDIIYGMEGNLCRCGAHNRIIDAVAAASKEMKGEPKS
ncbi:MAG: (2Fe-2S)-binding protein [Prolixibacteraceae bacterium]